MVLIGNIFGFLGSLLGSVIQSNSAAERQREANVANMELAKYQNQQNFLQWQRENEYNSPVNQLNRLKQAGINPALINGSTVDAGNASPLRYTRATVNPLPAINLGLDHMAQLELVGSQIDLNKAKARKENASAGNDEWQLHFNEDTKKLQIALMESRKENTEANTQRTLAAIRQVDEQLAQSHNLMVSTLNLNEEQMKTLAQARVYQVKEFGLKQWQVGQQVKIAWYNAGTSRMNAESSRMVAESTVLRNQVLNKMTDAEVGLLHEQVVNAIIQGDGMILENDYKQIRNFWSEHGIDIGNSMLTLSGMVAVAFEQAGVDNGVPYKSVPSSRREDYAKRAAQPTKKRK